MLALNEKARAVILILPELAQNDRVKTFRAKLAESYVEVVAEKKIYLTEADARSYFQFSMDPSAYKDVMQAATWGLSQVLLVEHLDGDVLERVLELVVTERSNGGNIFCSTDSWECVRDMEFFFPHLDSMPVERTLAVLKPDGLARGVMDGRSLEQLVEAEAAAAGLFIAGRKRMVADKATAEVLCQDLKGTDHHAGAVHVLTQEPGVVALCLEGRGAIGKWNLICGPAQSSTARSRAPSTIRAMWGTDSTSNAVHGSRDMVASERELKHMFPDGTLKLQRTLCIVKPDGMQNILAIRAAIKHAGFTVLKEKQMTFTEDRAKEFYRSLKGKPAFSTTVKEASSGPCTVMVLCRLEAVAVFKQLMGPEHSKEARQQRPRSLRALFGRDGQRNAVFGSESAQSAAWDICFFFPEIGSDPVPDDEEVRDFLFRKTAVASMDLKSLTGNTDTSSFAADPTLQQLLSKGLMALCQVQPKGVQAVKWLSQWLMDNNPNQPAVVAEGAGFAPPDRTKRFVEFGVNQDGMPFAVEAPRSIQKMKTVVEVDVSEDRTITRVSEFSKPPFVVFIIGGPGSGKGTVCARLRDEFKMIHLSTGDLMRDELKSQSALGLEMKHLMDAGQLVPDSIALRLIKNAMLKHQDTNRFLLDGFPRTLAQAKLFEQEVAEVSFIVNLECGADTMVGRILNRAQQAPGRADDNAEVAASRVQVFQNQTMSVIDYYTPIGKVRKVDGEISAEEVYATCRRYFQCRFLYLLGPPGAPIAALGDRLQSSYGYAAINLYALLKSYAASNAPDANKAKAALAAGKPVDASIACPLVLNEINRNMAVGVQNFVLCDFPQSIKQAEFVEFQVPSITKPLLLDFSQADAGDLVAAASGASDAVELDLRATTFFGAANKAMLQNMPNLVRVPCSISALDNLEGAAQMGFSDRVLEGNWQGLLEKVMPSITLVLGLPGSGTDKLASLLAKQTPNTQTVDCNELLDKELERKTEMGIMMHNMLAKGQVIPLSVTMELLKGVANLTASDSIIVQNCPLYVDQIDTISQNFRIEKVFYISGSSDTEEAWAEAYSTNQKQQEYFYERKSTLGPIVAHFSKQGNLMRIQVDESASKDDLNGAINRFTKPQYFIIGSISPKIAAKQSELLAAAMGSGKPVIPALSESWGSGQLQSYIQTNKLNSAVVGGSSISDASRSGGIDFVNLYEAFGPAKLMVNITCDDEYLEGEFKDSLGDEEFNAEEFANSVALQRTALDSHVLLAQAGGGAVLTIDRKSAKTPEELHQLIRKALLPKVYLIVAPTGKVDLGAMMAELICTSPPVDVNVPRRCSVIDASQLCTRGGHSPAVEDVLRKAAARGEPAGCLPPDVWAALFAEAFAKSPDPTGVFLVINYPVMTSRPGYTVQDQLALLHSVSQLKSIACLAASQAAYSDYCSTQPEDYEAYQTFISKVSDQVITQFGEELLQSSTISGPSGYEVQAQVLEAASSFDYLNQ